MKWASTVTEEQSLADAAEHAAQRILEDLGQAPDLALVFPSAHHRVDCSSLAAVLAEWFGDCLIVGCSAAGVIGGGREIEQQAGLSVTAAVLPGVELVARHLLREALPKSPNPPAWEALTGVRAAQQPHFLILADPFSFNPEPLTQGLDHVYPEAVKIGGLASGGEEAGGNVLVLGEHVHGAGLICLALTGNIAVDTVVAQGCRPIGEPLFVTKAHRNLLLELDGQRPIAVIEYLYERLSAHDRELCQHSLFLGIAMREGQGRYGQGDYLIRNIVGSDAASGALWVAAELKNNQIVQFHLRDADTAAYDLEQVLSRLDRLPRQERPAGSLLFSCVGRGMHLYGRADHDSHAFHRHVGDIPLGGFFCNGEIGPVHGKTFLHGYTSAFALFRAARPE